MGHFDTYSKRFKTQEEASDFIKNNDGINEVSLDDSHFGIDYEAPIPYMLDCFSGIQYIHSITDYIVRFSNGRIKVLSKKEFEELFEESNFEKKDADLFPSEIFPLSLLIFLLNLFS
jgi:hypothetical protein